MCLEGEAAEKNKKECTPFGVVGRMKFKIERDVQLDVCRMEIMCRS